ncbi:MAG: protein translocase subunit SecD [Phycisphaerae bacterium]|nr:protein translocase subunit SecD [Phycisphaerae bacterium]
MNDPNRTMKWLLVIGLVVLSIVILYPPQEKLKGGIDLVGGTSLLFEIDTSGLKGAELDNLSARVMEILKQRVDPQGQLNLEWRPVGNTRLEIRMPRPPKEALERRDAYNETLEQIQDMNIARFDVESALNEPVGERDQALDGLVRDVDERKPLIDELKTAFDAYRAAQATGDPEATDAASQKYEVAMGRLLRTSLPVNRLTDILPLPEGKRTEELDRLRGDFVSYGPAIEKVVTAYDQWAKNKAELEDPSDLKRRIRGAGVLEFRILADRDPASPQNTTAPVEPISKYVEQLQQRGPRPRAGDLYEWFPVENILRFTHLNSLDEVEQAKNDPGRPILEEYAGKYYVLMNAGSQYSMLQSGKAGARWSLIRAIADQDYMTGQNVVVFSLDPRGGQLFSELTGNNVGRQLCIMLDGQAMSHARINERISTTCQISGRFTPEQVFELKRILEAGSLPARVKETPLSENTIGPSLGETNRQKGMTASVVALICVVVFMLIYYGFVGGGMADVALALNLLFVLAAMALMQATFTLPGIAGLILTVGMAVDANVLIFERFREERDRGVVFKKALNTGYDKAFSTIFDANITTLITCFILGFVGSEEVKGFAIVLGIGIATSMFTALFVTRLVFNTLISAGWLNDLRMLRLIGHPQIDWMGWWKAFVPFSLTAVGLGLFLFIGEAAENREALFDIEFLGGTSVQVDLKPGQEMKDTAMVKAITSTEGDGAAAWLRDTAQAVEQANISASVEPGVFEITSDKLNGDTLLTMARPALEPLAEREGLVANGNTLRLIAKNATMDESVVRSALNTAARDVRLAVDRIRTAKVQSVGELGKGNVAHSFEIVTTETNRNLVEEAIFAAIGPKLDIQQALDFQLVTDKELTREPFFVVESQDHYLSDVIGGDAPYDIRRFRGGVAIQVQLDPRGPALTTDEFEKRVRQVGLQPEFEQFRTLESAIFPLGPAVDTPEGKGYHEFATLAVDDQLLYEDAPELWTENLARTRLAQIEAALGSEKSFSKIVAFAPQIAVQTKNRAIFAVVLALVAISAYLWLRFGSKEFGLAASVCLVHDVSITLGLLALSQFIYKTFIGEALMLSDFKIDLPMIASLLTLIGYSLNDTIVVFDRIRENRGKSGTITASLINMSINQTLSRTLLTSGTTLLVVLLLYTLGGDGVHGFAFALLAGIIIGTYSSIGVAAPLLLVPVFLRRIVIAIITLAVIGIIAAEAETFTARTTLIVIVAAIGLFLLYRDWAKERAGGGRLSAGTA